jgi:hypothetical protein
MGYMLLTQRRVVFDSQNSFTDDGPRPQVLMAYEDLNLALRAMNVLALVAREAGDVLKVQFAMWRFDYFNSPAMREAAVRQAQQADIIVVAPKNSSGGLSDSVTSWLEQWTGRRQVHPGALVAVFDPATGPHLATSLVVRQLHAAAGLTGMDFFFSALRQFNPAPACRRESPSLDGIQTLSRHATDELTFSNETSTNEPQ